jgi:hypothetical protein
MIERKRVARAAMEVDMGGGQFAIRRSDLDSLTPAQRHTLGRWLIRQAHQARARAIGEALKRLVGALCTPFWRP